MVNAIEESIWYTYEGRHFFRTLSASPGTPNLGFRRLPVMGGGGPFARYWKSSPVDIL